MIVQWAIAKIAVEQPTTTALKALYASVLLQEAMPQRFHSKLQMSKLFRKHASKDIAYQMIHLVQDATLFGVPLAENDGYGWYPQAFTKILEALGMKQVGTIVLEAEELKSFPAFRLALRKKVLYGINADVDGYVTISNQGQAKIVGKTSRTVQRWRYRMQDVLVRPNYVMLDTVALEQLEPEERKQLKDGMYRRMRNSYKIANAETATHAFNEKPLATEVARFTPEYGEASLRQTFHRNMQPDDAPTKTVAGAFDLFVEETALRSTGEAVGIFVRYRSWEALWHYGFCNTTNKCMPQDEAEYRSMQRQLGTLQKQHNMLTHIQDRSATPWRLAKIDELEQQAEYLAEAIKNHPTARAYVKRDARSERRASYAKAMARKAGYAYV